MLFNKEEFAEEIYIHASLENVIRNDSSIKSSSETIENLLCKHFPGFVNIAKKCLLADCVSADVGVAVKTFTSDSAKSICKTEKISEFNSLYEEYNGLTNYKKARFIACRYNDRLRLVKKQYGVKEMCYLVVMMNSKLKNVIIYEFPLSEIAIKNLHLTEATNGKFIHFTDGVNKFNFKMNKSTLYRTFILAEAESFSFNFSDIKVYAPQIPVMYGDEMRFYKIAG